MSDVRRVVARTTLPEVTMGPGFTARSLRRSGDLLLDPFLSLDEFRMSEPTFPPHPHAGFSAVTYLFATSAGAFVNRDSLGDRRRIAPGALHWTQAGRGMLHEEVPEKRGVAAHGMQMFVKLRAADELAPPRAFHLPAEEVPVHREGGAVIRVLAGSVGALRSPLDELLTPVLLLDVELSPRASVEIPVEPDHTLFALAIGGAGRLDADGASIDAHQAVGFAPGSSTLRLQTDGSPLHLLVAGGPPIGEPVVAGGPFVLSSEAAIRDAYARFRRGEMGSLAPSFGG